MKNKIHGIIPAIITPFTDKRKLDEKSLEKQVLYLTNGGVNGFFICGTTGEGVNLTTEEKVNVFKVIDANSSKSVFKGIAALKPATSLVIEEIEKFYESGVKPDFVAVVSPFYCKVSQEMIYDHFSMIAEKSPYPIFIYNIPQCTGNNIEVETIEKLSRNDNIIGIKDSSGNFISFLKILKMKSDNFFTIQGDDRLYANSFLSGADGAVSGLANIIVSPFVDMYNAVTSGDMKVVFKKQKIINKLFEIIELTGGKVIPSIKAAVYLTGRCKYYLKNRYMDLHTREIEIVKSVIDSFM